jgi:hypothetical protein
MRIAVATSLVLVLCFTPDVVLAQGGDRARTAVSLDQARASFAKGDTDKSNGLSSAELTALGLDATAMLASDWNSDQSLSSDEFLVGYHQLLVRQAKTVAADLEAESTRLQALRRAQRSEELKPRPAGERPLPLGPSQRVRQKSGETTDPAGAPVATPAIPSEPAAGPGAGPGAVRRPAAPSADTAAQTREEKLLAIQETLNRRVRNGDLTDEEARSIYASVSKRIKNGLNTGNAADPGAPREPELTREQQLLAIQASLNQRLRNADLSQREALGAYAKVDKRIDNALGKGKSTEGPASTGAPAITPPGAPEPSLEQKILQAQKDLTRRVRNGQVDPNQAGKAQERLRQRVERATGQPGSPAPTADAPAPGGARRTESPPAATPAPARTRETPAPPPPKPPQPPRDS